jgi:hypothetical protein
MTLDKVENGPIVEVYLQEIEVSQICRSELAISAAG